MRRLPTKELMPQSRQIKGNPSSTPSTSDSMGADQERGDAASQTVEDGENGFVELTLISAQGLKDVKIFGSMSPFAVVYIDPSCKHRTSTSDNTGSSPVWDYFTCLPIPAIGSSDTPDTTSTENNLDDGDLDVTRSEADDDHQNLTIEIYSQGALSDVLVGTAHIPLQEIVQNAAGKLQYLACQLVRPSGRIQGLVNLSVQFKGPSLPHDLLRQLKSKAPKAGHSRNSWFFLAEGETAGTRMQVKSIAAPDILDFQGDGEGAGTGGISRSSSSPTESMNASTPHSPITLQTEFLHVPLSQQVNQHQHQHQHQHQNQHQHQHQHQHQQLGGVKPMFDSAFDALVVSGAVNDDAATSMLQGDRGSENALFGLAMSQPLQGDNAPFGPSQ